MQQEDWDTKERVVPTERARSATKTGHMRYVLGFGIVGVIIAFFLAWLFMYS